MRALPIEEPRHGRSLLDQGVACLDAIPGEARLQASDQFGRLVARDEGRVVGWAALSPVSRRPCYAGVAEVSFYVGAAFRGRGIGRRLLEALIRESERHGIWTLQGASFAENEASLRLQSACGFREVGRRERIAQLHGAWRDTVITERRSAVAGADTTPT